MLHETKLVLRENAKQAPKPSIGEIRRVINVSFSQWKAVPFPAQPRDPFGQAVVHGQRL